MVKEITAWQASDGSVHGTQRAAAEQDARVNLKALNLFNEATILAVIANASLVIEALAPLIQAQATGTSDA